MPPSCIGVIHCRPFCGTRTGPHLSSDVDVSFRWLFPPVMCQLTITESIPHVALLYRLIGGTNGWFVCAFRSYASGLLEHFATRSPSYCDQNKEENVSTEG